MHFLSSNIKMLLKSSVHACMHMATMLSVLHLHFVMSPCYYFIQIDFLCQTIIVEPSILSYFCLNLLQFVILISLSLSAMLSLCSLYAKWKSILFSQTLPNY
uniref:Uncharacterized protein n=1 Tax=Octopus bimaculoides TaxID=37653 RepID=A0A0L8HGQ0_OCTBM